MFPRDGVVLRFLRDGVVLCSLDMELCSLEMELCCVP